MGDTAITVVCNNYDASSGDAATQTVAPVSYFVVGAARGDDDDPPTAVRGDDLVSGVSFKDDLRGTVESNKTYYRDDGETKTTSSARATLTNELLTRGGWRDHTDGNRISTTRGDVIDVVYGNYKLIVKGRIDDGSDSDNAGLGECFFDASGGHIAESTSTGGTVIKCEWDSDEQDGCWKTFEQTDSGDKKVVHTGYYEREYYGESTMLDIGQGCGTLSYDRGASTAPAHSAHKPDIQDYTYARSIDVRKKYASFNGDWRYSGTSKNHTHVKSSYHRAFGAGSHISWLYSVAFKEELLADKINEKREYNYKTLYELGAVKCDIRTIGLHNTVENRSDYTAWLFGIDLRATVGGLAKFLCGLDTYYRCDPSADLLFTKTCQLNLTVDLWMALSRLTGRISKRDAKLAKLTVGMTEVDNAAANVSV